MGSIGILCVLFTLLAVIAIASKPSPKRKLFFPVLAALYACLFVFPTKRGFPIGIYATTLLAYASDLILFSEPQISLRRERQGKPVREMALFERLYWAASLACDWRGVQWSTAIPNLQRSHLPRWGFVKSRLCRALTVYFIRNIVFFCIHHNPALNGIDRESFGTHGFLWQTWNVFMFWFSIWATLYMNHSVASAFAVAAGLSEPRDWPNFFGPWLRTTTVRRFWGKSWHQMMRRPVTGAGKYLARNVLKFRAGSALSSYTQLYVAFLLSGIIHAAGDWMAMRSITSARLTIQYYIMQAMVITVEDMVIAAAKKFGISRIPFFVSYAWVIWWMAWSGPMWIETVIQAEFSGGLPSVSHFQRLLNLLDINRLVGFAI
ncbi:uncharacterized protein LACBIDRAFT_308235 [Laccaria bicolor S238N-H82]|uniref:Predicted protein n=1 Tax=Laccaria bicolor (strain S238N-H82 / ATCC MYA-4686) TaxID=486041 RepID=B0DRW4_LACBS|nr:uncharacterized protein LACBIDRAFT_308235 [Laccaria bicolor S238N-H82]EDR02596.1 predicted protein [Laccaria bicolor S238N-H82]|eukprot:XP_001886640.1 predicted protein [Laccaria bicolor S238N-H82]